MFIFKICSMHEYTSRNILDLGISFQVESFVLIMISYFKRASLCFWKSFYRWKKTFLSSWSYRTEYTFVILSFGQCVVYFTQIQTLAYLLCSVAHERSRAKTMQLFIVIMRFFFGDGKGTCFNEKLKPVHGPK